MDHPEELTAVLSRITDSLTSAGETLPDSAPRSQNGLSLLDLKNNLLLSYIQNLSLLILAKLDNPDFTLQNDISQKIIWNLIRDRVHLERGVSTLETKLAYQIRKLIRSAEDANSSSKDENLRFKPNPSALVVATQDTTDKTETYKPPRISSTALPASSTDGPRRNKVLEEFISSSSLSAQPVAVPSVGSNLTGIGSRNEYKSSKQADIAQYEEENFIRLNPKIGKEKQKGRKQRGGMEGFGGEDWSGLERIGRGNWEFGKRESKVERSRKRGFEESAGESVSGQAFEKRKKILHDRKNKKKQRGGKK
jgi:U3 small nucleolar ribonucleoprotein protein LCP5